MMSRNDMPVSRRMADASLRSSTCILRAMVLQSITVVVYNSAATALTKGETVWVERSSGR